MRATAALAALAVCVLALHVEAGTVVIDNTRPRFDVNGSIIDAHDGTYRKFGDYYYYHAAQYGLCEEPPNYGCDQTPDHCGFGNNHNISIWRSKDLSSGSWEFRGHAIQCAEMPNCQILYRPHLVFNPNTQLYVLFWNYVGVTGYAGYGVATGPTPEGPFTLRNPQMNITRLCPGPVAQEPCGAAQGGAGDFDVFVDDDGSAYILYSANFYMSIEKLSPDYLYSMGTNASCGGSFGGTVFPEYFVEAPAFFKRGDTYYILFGHCCCYCYQGSGIIVHTAKNPLGPWTAQSGGDIACRAPSDDEFVASLASAPSLSAIPTPGQGCLYGGSNDVSVTRSQQNFIIEVETTNGTEYVWTGDRWQQAPDGIKGHDPQYWVPLVFNRDGSIANVTWVDQFTLNLP